MVLFGLIPIPNVRGLLLLAVVAVAGTMFCGCLTRTYSGGGGDSARDRSDANYEATVRGARIYGAENRSAPPFLRVNPPGIGSSGGGFGAAALTVECDLIADAPPSLALVLVHCDRNWKPTQSVFIQDRSRLRANDFLVERAAIGVLNYDYSARITFPSESNLIEIRHSGNYIAQVVDYYNENKVLAELRFFAVEATAGVRLDVISDFYESAWTSKLQEGLVARAEVTPGNTIFTTQFTGVHLYEQGKWLHPLIADDDSRRRAPEKGTYRSTWSSYFGGKVVAEFFNIPAGNERRILDLSDVLDYPPSDGVLTTRLSDQPRFATFSEQDNDGLTVYNYVSPEDDDYVYFEFRLDLEGREVKDEMAVVGTFNDWTPTWDWRLVFDPASKLYVARGWIRRAMHEYEYVTGKWNIDKGVLEKAEATLIEGNNVYATQTWYALAYYHDETSLSYDRIVGVGIDGSGGR